MICDFLCVVNFLKNSVTSPKLNTFFHINLQEVNISDLHTVNVHQKSRPNTMSALRILCNMYSMNMNLYFACNTREQQTCWAHCQFCCCYTHGKAECIYAMPYARMSFEWQSSVFRSQWSHEGLLFPHSKWLFCFLTYVLCLYY